MRAKYSDRELSANRLKGGGGANHKSAGLSLVTRDGLWAQKWKISRDEERPYF